MVHNCKWPILALNGIYVFLWVLVLFSVFPFCSVLSLSIPPSSISLPSQACSCCVRWTGMMASISGSMRTLFAACTLNTQLLHPSLLICYFFPASSCGSSMFFPRSFDSLSFLLTPYSPCWQPVHLLPLRSLIRRHQYASCHRMPVTFCFFIVQPVRSVYVCGCVCVICVCAHLCVCPLI